MWLNIFHLRNIIKFWIREARKSASFPTEASSFNSAGYPMLCDIMAKNMWCKNKEVLYSLAKLLIYNIPHEHSVKYYSWTFFWKLVFLNYMFIVLFCKCQRLAERLRFRLSIYLKITKYGTTNSAHAWSETVRGPVCQSFRMRCAAAIAHAVSRAAH